MTENPYQSPTIVERMIPDRGRVKEPTPRVDGKWLVVRSEDELPRFCVKTNEPVSVLDMQTKGFTWCSPLVGLLILLSGLILIIVYFLVRKRCYLTFGLSEHLQRRYRNRFIGKIVAACVLFIALPMTATMGDVVPIIVLLLFLIAIISLFFGNSPLAVAKFSNNEFWISGCCQEFLNRMKVQADSTAT